MFIVTKLVGSRTMKTTEGILFPRGVYLYLNPRIY